LPWVRVTLRFIYSFYQNTPVELREMMSRKDTPPNNFTLALEAIGNLALRDLYETLSGWEMAALVAHDEIQLAPISRKTSTFYRHFVPLRKNLISLLALTYRRYFKLALAHPRQIGHDPDKWAQSQVQPAFVTSLECIRDWYILACEGRQLIGTVEYRPEQTVSLPLQPTDPPPPESWRAPAWLFQVSAALVGVGPLKTEHVPETDSEQKLTAPHTRLLLKGGRRVFLWELTAAIERARNEETAAAGAIPTLTVGGEQAREPKKPKHWLKGIEGLTRRADLSRFKQGLTERQELAFSLKYEYQVGPAELAARMGIDRKTASEHIEAADRKIKQLHSSEKARANRAKKEPDL
jgi:hypothetical protein